MKKLWLLPLLAIPLLGAIYPGGGSGGVVTATNAILRVSGNGTNTSLWGTTYVQDLVATKQAVATLIATNSYLDLSLSTNFLGRTNALSTWPTAASNPGGATFVNSNGTVFLLISSPGGTAWTSTNKIAP